MFVFFFFKQKTAYEMRISDWSSDVCSSDLNVTVVHVVDCESVRHAMSETFWVAPSFDRADGPFRLAVQPIMDHISALMNKAADLAQEVREGDRKSVV